MTLIMLMALAVPAFAVNKESDPNSEAEVQEEILESASEFAYLDADKATPELKEKILEARKEIIYNTDWVADGYVGCIRNIKTCTDKTAATFVVTEDETKHDSKQLWKVGKIEHSSI